MLDFNCTVCKDFFDSIQSLFLIIYFVVDYIHLQINSITYCVVMHDLTSVFLDIINFYLSLLSCGYNSPVNGWYGVNIISLPKTIFPGVAIIVRWEEAFISQDIYVRVSPHGYIWSKILLSIYFVTSVFNITWCTQSNGELSCRFSVFVKTGFI